VSLLELTQVMDTQHPLVHAVPIEHDGQHAEGSKDYDGDRDDYFFSVHWMIFLSGLKMYIY